MTGDASGELSPETAKELVAAARSAAVNAHAPYSNFKVGAAVLTGGRILTGCNVENASYGLTICAERVAVGSAVTAGARSIDAAAVWTETKPPSAPCGACRQVLAEFGPNMPVILAGPGADPETLRLGDLLPRQFDLSNRTIEEAPGP